MCVCVCDCAFVTHTHTHTHTQSLMVMDRQPRKKKIGENGLVSLGKIKQSNNIVQLAHHLLGEYYEMT